MRVKQGSTRKRWSEFSHRMLTFAAALLSVASASAQTPIQPAAPVPSGVRESITHRLQFDPSRQLSRTVYPAPHKAEKSPNSILGSLLTESASQMLTSSESPTSLAGHRTKGRTLNHQLQGSEYIVDGPMAHGPFASQLDVYRARASILPDAAESDGNHDNAMQKISFGMWWQRETSEPLGLSAEALPVDIAGLTHTALVSSPLVQSILTEPRIRRSDVVMADADFDPLAFIEAKFGDSNEPVGNTLTIGPSGDDRFRDKTYATALGLSKKSRYGGTLELIQRGGHQSNNSTFLLPNPQGTSRLELNFTQPMLKDHGHAVNNTRVLLAKIDVQLAIADVRGALEEHLTSVTRAYWELFQARAEWLQRNRLLEEATKLHEVLQARSEVDSQKRQILRAHVAVTSRRSDLVRAETRIRNSQAELRLLTGDPALIQASRWELLPQDEPMAVPAAVSMRQATLTALDNRPDVAKSIRAIQAVSARVGAAKNQVLPRLDLILSTYVAGLDGNRDVFGALEKQFTEGRPSYAAGIQFEVPLGNRASRARLERNRWELTKVLYEFQQVTETVFAEVEVAVRETRTAFEEMATKKQAIDASNSEVSYLEQRWRLLPDPNESAVLLIEDLFDAQERRADQERKFVQAQVGYAMSWVHLRRSMGVLLRMEKSGPMPLVDPVQEASVPAADREQVAGRPSADRGARDQEAMRR
jgi:outer membrane protein TolC